MDKEQALNLLTQVCAQYRGTLEEHNALQEALGVVKELLSGDEQKNNNKHEVVL